MATRHLQMLLRSNSMGAAHLLIEQAAALLRDIEHPLARDATSLAERLLDAATSEVAPLAGYLDELGNEVSFSSPDEATP